MLDNTIIYRALSVISALLLSSSLQVAAQNGRRHDRLYYQQKNDDTEGLLKDLIESIAENLPEDVDLSQLTERLSYFQKHPIELNSASLEALKELIFLSPLQINAYLSYLDSNGPLLDFSELQSIDGFDILTIERLRPFVYLKVPTELKQITFNNLKVKSNNDLMIRYSQLLQLRKGFRNLPGSRYLGTPEKLLLRYRFSYADLLSIGILLDKDPGEQIFNSKTLADHLSLSLGLYKIGPIKKLIAGDYSLQFGQGLSLWSGFAFGKGPDVTSVAAKDTGIRTYSSSNESSFFRGLASTIGLSRHLEFNGFVSYRNLDASLTTLPDGTKSLSNINTSGLHRTATELKNQRTVSQTIYGAALQFSEHHFGIGALAYRSLYGQPFIPTSAAYNRFNFRGRDLTNLSFYYRYAFRNYYFYGETAHSVNSGWALINGLMASLTAKFSVVLVHRKYAKDYHTFFGQTIGEGTEVNNEEGLYTGFNFMPSRKWTFALYSDYFNFPWLKYRISAASKGQEWLTQLSFTPHKRFKAQFRYKTELKQQNPDSGSGRIGLDDVHKQTFRADCNWWPVEKINLQSRAECSGYKKGPPDREYGLLICQDINYKPMSSRLSGNLRLAWFHTASYNSRIYAYEDDVLYSASSGIYYGKGIRGFVNLRYRLTPKIDVWARYAAFFYNGQETIGSGLDEIDGSRKEEVKLQLRYQF